MGELLWQALATSWYNEALSGREERACCPTETIHREGKGRSEEKGLQGACRALPTLLCAVEPRDKQSTNSVHTTRAPT